MKYEAIFLQVLNPYCITLLCLIQTFTYSMFVMHKYANCIHAPDKCGRCEFKTGRVKPKTTVCCCFCTKLTALKKEDWENVSKWSSL